MFYSQCLLSRKGALGAIWLAAHFHRKLKKSQVLQTNIPSSVDYIIKDPIEVPTALRISGHLLLGVVRIYSKKVDYLYDDCNETLSKLRTWGTIEINLSAPESVAPFDSITLPDRFELDALDIEDLGYSTKDCRGEHVKPYEQISLDDDMEQPEILGLALGYHMDASSCRSIPTCNFSMEDELLPPCPMDVDFSMNELDGFHNDAPVEKHQEKHAPHDIFEHVIQEAPEGSDAVWQSRRFESQLASGKESSHESEILRKMKNFNIEQVQVSSKEAAMTSKSLPQDAVTPELAAVPTPKKLEDRKSRKRKLPFKKPAAKTLFFDEIVILSNEIMRNRLHDSSGMVRSRKMVPLSVLDVQKLSTLSSMQRMFFEPLIPCISQDLWEFLTKGLSENKLIVQGMFPSAFTEVHETTPTFDGTPIDDEEHFPSTADDKHPELPAKKRLRPRQLVLNNDEPDSVWCKTPDAGTEKGTFHERIPDFKLNLLDDALKLAAESEPLSDFQGDANWSIKTRVVAHFLREACKSTKVQNQDKSIKVEEILRGKTKKECARFFMEILVLNTQDFIHAEQESPYTDIQLRPRPKLDRL